MLVYWSMLLVPAFSAFVANTGERDRTRSTLPFLFVVLAFTVIIGVRFEVGGDWAAYEEIVDYSTYEPLLVTLGFKDPAFGLVAWVSGNLGLGSAGANSACGALLMWGLWRFGKRQREPWLVLLAAVPYLIIVVGMGYVRQGAAIGLLLLAITRFEDRRYWWVTGLILLASLFHVTAIILAPIMGLAMARKRPLAMVPIGVVGGLVVSYLLISRLDQLFTSYVQEGMDSSGAGVRLAMNAAPALVFLPLRNRFGLDSGQRMFWTIAAAVSVLLGIAVLLTDATTLLDRIGLYLIPVQLFVFGNIGPVLSKDRLGHSLVHVGLIGYTSGVLFVWLNFATHAEYWLPYQTIFLD